MKIDEINKGLKNKQDIDHCKRNLLYDLTLAVGKLR